MRAFRTAATHMMAFAAGIGEASFHGFGGHATALLGAQSSYSFHSVRTLYARVRALHPNYARLARIFL